MARVEIDNVIGPRPKDARLWGSCLDSPAAGDRFMPYAIPIQGWVVGRNARAVEVEVLHDGERLLSVPVNQTRRDIAAAFSHVPNAAISGFTTAISVLTLPGEFELRLRAIFDDGNHAPLGLIRARRAPLQLRRDPALQPLLVVTLGRTGSSWLMQLLGQHPQILAYSPFRYEPRVAGSWASIFRTLSAPSCYRFPLRPDLSDPDWWMGRSNVSAMPPIAEPELENWLGGEHVEEVAAFCQDRTESLYKKVAAVEGRERPVFFAEKMWPDARLTAILRELYPDLQQVLLVRDFRDMVCSIASFNAKRGYASFGRERAESDEEHIRNLRYGAVRMLNAWQQGAGGTHLVRYEDLIEAPQATLRTLLDAINLDSSPEVVGRLLRRGAEEVPNVQKAHQTSDDPKSSVGRWISDLEPELQAVCDETFGEVLDAFGYARQSTGRTDVPSPTFAKRLEQLLRETIPARAWVRVVANEVETTGDGAATLRFFDERPAFAATPGTLDVRCPADCLGELHRRGVNYLVFPPAARLWLDRQPHFRTHLEHAAECAAERHDVALVYKLS